MNLISLIIENTVKIPTHPALSFQKEGSWKTYTWEELLIQINKTTNGLIQTGIKKGDCIGIFSQNSKDWLIFDLAVQSIGAITVPIYATNNVEQTDFIIRQTEMKAILVGNAAQYQMIKNIEKELDNPLHIFTSYPLEEGVENTYYLEKWSSDFPTEYHYKEHSAEDLATIIYTSGTTGVPKGVMLTHGSFSEVIKAHKIFFGIQHLQHKKSLAFLPLSHIFERSWSLFVLSQGGEVAVLDDPKNILSALKTVQPHSMCAVPRFYEKVYQTLIKKIESASASKQKIFKKALEIGKSYAEKIQYGEKIPLSLQLKYGIFKALVFNKIKNELGGNLNFLPVGGAALKKEISEFFAAIGMPVIVGYGLTETTATVTAYPSKNFKHGSVGKVLPGVEIKIGKEDEILVKYGGVMKGYYKNPEETAKVFTEDGYFRTGDAGRIDEEGNLFITDRIKDLMKTSNGKYIAPQVIEVPLQSHPAISQAMVVAEGKPYVSAFIVPDFDSLIAQYQEFKNYISASIEEKKKLLETPFIKEKFEKIVSDIQKELPSFEKIKKFKLLPEEFSIEKGELTPTLKIRRKIVMENLHSEIERFYRE
ncbi:MAG: long-chain fatty acid--CoA ligase [Cloacibacterium sp.]|nr:long-chain fatty acid--CoA ligase [Cloacibacterium sp.]